MVWQGRYRIPITTAFLHINNSLSISVGLFWHIPHIYSAYRRLYQGRYGIPIIAASFHMHQIFSSVNMFLLAHSIIDAGRTKGGIPFPSLLFFLILKRLFVCECISLHRRRSFLTHSICSFDFLLHTAGYTKGGIAFPSPPSLFLSIRNFSYEWVSLHIPHRSLCTFRCTRDSIELLSPKPLFMSMGFFFGEIFVLTRSTNTSRRLYLGRYRIPITNITFHMTTSLCISVGLFWRIAYTLFTLQAIQVSHSHHYHLFPYEYVS